MMNRISYNMFLFVFWLVLAASAPAHPQAQPSNPPVHDLEDWGAECAQAPFAVARYLCQGLISYPKATTLRVQWNCLVAEHLDQFYCVYNVHKTTLATTYMEAGTNYKSVYRLYHVTKAVLQKAAREPMMVNGRGLNCNEAMASLLQYGARRKP